MNTATISPVRLSVTTVTKDKSNEFIAEFKDKMPNGTTALTELMNMALVIADYGLDTVGLPEGFSMIGSTGYYDEMTDVVFLDENNEPVRIGSTVSAYDLKTHRRLIITVVAEGVNFIVHDRYSISDKNAVVLVMTEGRGRYRNVIGMTPAWSEGCQHDLVCAAHFFGFEYDRNKDVVHVPFSRSCTSPLMKDVLGVTARLSKGHGKNFMLDPAFRKDIEDRLAGMQDKSIQDFWNKTFAV